MLFESVSTQLCRLTSLWRPLGTRAGTPRASWPCSPRFRPSTCIPAGRSSPSPGDTGAGTDAPTGSDLRARERESKYLILFLRSKMGKGARSAFRIKIHLANRENRRDHTKNSKMLTGAVELPLLDDLGPLLTP